MSAGGRAEPFSREDIAGWRERHTGPEPQCPLDMQPRPCLTERWLATLDAATTHRAFTDWSVTGEARTVCVCGCPYVRPQPAERATAP